MLISKIGWASVIGLLVLSAACGKSEDDEGDDDSAGAGHGGSGAGRAAGGGAGAGAVAGRGAGAGSGGNAAGRGGSAGKAGNTASGGSAGQGAGAGHGGTEAGQNGGGRSGGGGTAGASAGDAGAPEGGADPGALEAVEDTIATACTAAATCCAAPGITPMLDDCESTYSAHHQGIAGIVAGYVTVDSASLARCKAAYESAADQCNLNAIVAACEGVFIGHQAVGEPCAGGYDCDRSTDTMTCLITGSSGQETLGTCEKVPRAQLNESCSGTCSSGDDCSSTTYGFATTDDLALCFEDDGLYCEYLESGSVCRAALPLGEPCGEASPDACGSKAHCDTTCVALSDLGESCGSCIDRFTCVDGKCADPDWANDSTCMGYPPGP